MCFIDQVARTRPAASLLRCTRSGRSAVSWSGAWRNADSSSWTSSAAVRTLDVNVRSKLARQPLLYRIFHTQGHNFVQLDRFALSHIYATSYVGARFRAARAMSVSELKDYCVTIIMMSIKQGTLSLILRTMFQMQEITRLSISTTDAVSPP